MPITANRLTKLEAAYRAASEEEDKTRRARNAGVRQALAEGRTHAWVSEAIGLSRGRVNQIAQGNDE